MEVTLDGIVTLVRPLCRNASLPMVVTVLGIVTLVMFEQTVNAPLSMVVTPDGIVTLVIEGLLAKA